MMLAFSSACRNEPQENMGKSKISGICRGQKIFFRKNGRYANLEELVRANLADDDLFRDWGYKTDVKITDTGYFAAVVPSGFTNAGMFYVDEKGIIKAHYGDRNIEPNDAECSYPNGAKCSCYEN